MTLTGWGVAVALLGVFGLVVFDLPWLAVGLLVAAGLCCAAVGAWTAATRRDAPEDAGTTQAVVELSVPTFVATLGVTGVLVALVAGGPGLLWPAAVVAVVGLAGLVREGVR
jgi:hypothetical protein